MLPEVVPVPVGKVGLAICLTVVSAPLCAYVTSKAVILSKNVPLLFACHSRWTQTVSNWSYLRISDMECGTFMLPFSSAPVYHWGCAIVWGTSVYLSGMTSICHLPPIPIVKQCGDLLVILVQGSQYAACLSYCLYWFWRHAPNVPQYSTTEDCLHMALTSSLSCSTEILIKACSCVENILQSTL
jgi:hypothetical protein